MPLYLVSYDIAEQHGDEYEPLWAYLDGLGSIKVLYFEYATPFAKTALDLATAVNTYLKKGDHLLVCELFKGGKPILGSAYAMGCKVHGIIRAIEAESLRLGIVKP